jgi:membrane-associated phospholipid phosphatase
VRAVLDTLSPPEDAVSLPQPVQTARAQSAPAISRPAAQYGWLAGSAVLLLAVIAERWLLASHTFPGDPWAARLGASHKWWLVWDYTRAYQQVGRPLVAVGEVALMLWWLWRSGGRRTLQGLALALGGSVSCGLIKIICGPTPLWLALHHVGTNFPSGVVTFTTATGGYLALVAWREGRRLMPALLLLVIAGSGPARVLGGQHLLSDVLGGYMLGAAWLIVAYTYLVTPANRTREDARWNFASLETLD